MDLREELTERAHQAPPDPHTWPATNEAQSGQGMVQRSRAEQAAAARSGTQQTQPPAPAPAPGAADEQPAASEPEPRTPAEVTLGTAASEVRRGEPLEVHGLASAAGQPCAFGRVDILLQSDGREQVFLGALATDARGAFAGAVTVPLNVQVGDYSVIASTPGIGHCSPSRRR
jgi:hypothetical protein